MTHSSDLAAGTHPAPGSSRDGLLHLLQDGGTHTVRELAAATGLHENTTREHLQRLVDDGLAQRAPEHRTVRGRPRTVYRAAGAHDSRAAARDRVDPAVVREALARVLLGGYGREVAPTAAEAAGRELAHDPVFGARAALPGTPGDARERQLAALGGHLDRLGFAPTLERGAPAYHLHHCPFLDLARERPDVVCAVHVGLARGVLEAVPGPVRIERLRPFVGPGPHCVLDLAVVPSDDDIPSDPSTHVRPEGAPA